MLNPVSPTPASSSDTGRGFENQTVHEGEGVEEEIDLRLAMLDDPIVGVEQVVWDQHGPGALKPRALPTPKAMSPAEKEEHDLTHLPFHPGCELC